MQKLPQTKKKLSHNKRTQKPLKGGEKGRAANVLLWMKLYRDRGFFFSKNAENPATACLLTNESSMKGTISPTSSFIDTANKVSQSISIDGVCRQSLQTRVWMLLAGGLC